MNCKHVFTEGTIVTTVSHQPFTACLFCEIDDLRAKLAAERARCERLRGLAKFAWCRRDCPSERYANKLCNCGYASAYSVCEGSDLDPADATGGG